MKKNLLDNIILEDIDVSKFHLLTIFKSDSFKDAENNLITKLIVPELIEQDWVKQIVKISIAEPTYKDGSTENFISTIYKISQSQDISLKLIYMKKKFDIDQIFFIKSYPIYSYLNGKYIEHNMKLIDNFKIHELKFEFKNFIPLYE